MNISLVKLWKPFFTILPHHPYVLKQCRRYCNVYLGENEGDMKDNGELFFVSQHIRDCQVVFDIGANEGDWTNHVLRINPNLQVHCFEPSPSIFLKLKERVHSANVQFVPFGLSGKDEELEFFQEGYSLYERIGDHHVDQSHSVIETVSLTTISGYMERNEIDCVDFVKMDIEGHELQALKGGLNEFKLGRIKRLYFEYNTTFIDAGVFLKDIFMLFKNLDYRIYKLMPDHLQRVEAYDNRLENFQFKHFGLVHRSIPETGLERMLEL